MSKHFLLTVILFVPAMLHGQITGIKEVKDKQSIKLNNRALEKLCANDWFLHNATFSLNHDSTYDITDGQYYPHYGNRVVPHKFNKDSTFEATNTSKGKWKVFNKRNLILDMDSVMPDPHGKYKHYHNVLNKKPATGILGTYAVYELTDSSLLLVKVLTSDGGNRLTYLFKDYKKKPNVNRTKRVNRIESDSLICMSYELMNHAETESDTSKIESFTIRCDYGVIYNYTKISWPEGNIDYKRDEYYISQKQFDYTIGKLSLDQK